MIASILPTYNRAPLSFDRGEVTDKGSINQRAVLRNRADLVACLWSDDPRVITLGSVRAG